MRLLKGHKKTVRHVVYSPDGKRLLSGGQDGLVNLWDLATGEASRLHKGKGNVFAVAFHPNGNLIALGQGSIMLPTGAGRSEIGGSGSKTAGNRKGQSHQGNPGVIFLSRSEVSASWRSSQIREEGVVSKKIHFEGLGCHFCSCGPLW
jgi:WD40 repeat protein